MTVPAHAYIGPGAGVAFVSSFLVVLITLFLALFTLLTWPIRWAVQTLRGQTALRKSRVRRVIVLGLDGQDPNLTEKLMEQGHLPDGIILTSETYALVKDHFNAVELDPVQVKGIAREIRPYELHGSLVDVGAEKSVISIENEAVKIFVDVSRLDDTGREKTAQQLDELAARLRQA